MPVWHASASLQHRKRGRLDAEAYIEAAAVDVCRGVGAQTEWWQWGDSLVGHLRIPVTIAENTLIPPGLVTTDAGPEGTHRLRTI